MAETPSGTDSINAYCNFDPKVMTTTECSKPVPTQTRSKLELAAALSGVMTYTSANGFMTGGLGVAGRQLGLTEVEIGLILGLGALIGVVAAPAWGYAAEIWSRRKLMLWAVPMVALGPAVMAVVMERFILLSAAISGIVLGAARLLQAIFGAALIPVAQGYMADFTEPSQRLRGMGALSAAISFGTLSGSVLLWLTGHLGVAAGFAIISVFGLFASLMGLAYLPQDVIPRTALPREETALPLADIWQYLAITLVGFTCYTTVPPIFALRLVDKYGMDGGTAAVQTGLVLTVGVLAVCIAQVWIASWHFKRPRGMLGAGSAGIFIGLIALLFARDILGMCLSMAVIGFAVGFLAPAVLGAMSVLSGRGAQGKIGGINMAARGLGSALGPVLGTVLYQADRDAPIWGSLAMIMIIFLLTFVSRDPRALAS
ncbi:MFS family permease [Rhizobium sp. BK529]|uniref:MFS transporter n=1 Tax=Rhizobium sp. BK529 TaxID=2586983 RepID=UPI0017E6F356|nr:MFS transporter [Rhizobium sp. BK529]MBB3595136.1 MFS family permease [Rhizobium sp. BK529]